MAELRKIAIVGSARIPFTRAYTGYAEETNLSMLTAALAGIAEKFGLKGEAVSEVMGGSPYGASTIAGTDGSRQPSKIELEGARYQGKHVAEIAAKVAGR